MKNQLTISIHTFKSVNCSVYTKGKIKKMCTFYCDVIEQLRNWFKVNKQHILTKSDQIKFFNLLQHLLFLIKVYNLCIVFVLIKLVPNGVLIDYSQNMYTHLLPLTFLFTI